MKTFRTKSNRWAALGLIFLGVLGFAQTLDEPITNFKLPLFNDDGYRTGYLRGEQAIILNEVEIRILGMELNQYTGDERDAVIGLMESPEALFRMDQNKKRSAAGPGSIKLENDSFVLTGDDWIWQENGNQLVINKNVKIVIFSAIGNVIK